MAEKDVEMEDTGNLLEDEVVSGQENVEKKHPVVEEVGEEQEKSSGRVKEEIQNPSEIAEEEKMLSGNVDEEGKLSSNAEDETHPDQTGHELPVDETDDSEKDATATDDDSTRNNEKGATAVDNDMTRDNQKDSTAMDDDKTHDTGKDATAMDDDKTNDTGKDATAMDDDKTNDTGKDATAMDDDKTNDTGKDATAMDDDKTNDTGKDATAMDDDETHDNEKDATAMDDDKTHDNEKDVTAMDDDKTHDNEKDATALDDDKTHDTGRGATAVDDDKTRDTEKDAAAVANDNGVQGDTDGDAFMKVPEDKCEGDDTIHEKHKEVATPNNSPLTCSASKAEDHSAEMPTNELEDTKMDEGYESGTPEDQAAFMKELETFYKEKNMEFKPPKFYGQPLNCLKLWRSVIKLGGYDPVTGSKLWRQIGESFHPPKTCTTVSWTFRNFYEKALLEYERHKMHSGELELPLAAVLPEASTVENEANGNQAPGSGRARRDAAARAMQGWHVQRLFGYGEDKNPNNSQKREKSLKSIGSLKQKRPSEVEQSVKAARTETSRQVVTTVADVGPPADWVKVNVRETKDSFEVYALVPGLLREEVRVQSDPAGRVVITGQPEQPDNPWGITAFKKVISLPSRIDPLRTSAIVSLHGRLFVRVPFEHDHEHANI